MRITKHKQPILDIFNRLLGYGPSTLETLHLTFLGWNKEKKRDVRPNGRGNGEVDFYCEELQEGRELPPFPKGIILIHRTDTLISFFQFVRLVFKEWARKTPTPEERKKEREGSPTPPGATLGVTFLSDQITPEEILAYLEEIGLDVAQ